jgi:pyrroloquinoline quinone biosynthesis protein B
VSLRHKIKLRAFIASLFGITACSPVPETPSSAASCEVEFIVLGVGQDAGIPQIGNSDDPAWRNPAAARFASSAALVDHTTGKRYLFEATPDIRAQLKMLDDMAPSDVGPLGLSGIFLTHAHIGHYAGLMFVGHESASTRDLPVYAMPRMVNYLSSNGPWDQLVRYQNISLQGMVADQPVRLGEALTVTPMKVPHRDEYSETVGFRIETAESALLFLPDIDSWARWETEYDTSIETVARDTDYLFVDATFFDNNELPGRDMSKIPHPRVTETMERFTEAPDDIKSRIHFIHFNHTNPLRDSTSAQSRLVRQNGFNIAAEGQRLCLATRQD